MKIIDKYPPKILTWEEYGLPLYHGTDENYVENILSEGLLAKNSVEHTSNDPLIFVEDSMEKAIVWACRHKDPAVIRIYEVPEDCEVTQDKVVGNGAYKIGKCSVISPENLGAVDFGGEGIDLYCD